MPSQLPAPAAFSGHRGVIQATDIEAQHAVSASRAADIAASSFRRKEADARIFAASFSRLIDYLCYIFERRYGKTSSQAWPRAVSRLLPQLHAHNFKSSLQLTARCHAFH